MKKFLIFLFVLIALAVVAVVTCPDRDAHKDAIMSVLDQKIDEIVASESSSELSALGTAIGTSLAEFAVDKRLTVKNYFVFSTGEMLLDEEPRRLSVGVFGHVFTFSKEDLDKMLEEAM